MADLGNLWFSLGLDDSKFEKQWNKAFAKYQQKSNINVGLTIDKSQLSQLAGVEKTLNQFKKNFNGKIKGKIDLEITQRTLDSLNALKSMGGSVDQWKAIQQAAKAAGRLAIDQAKVNNILLQGQKDTTKEYKVQSLWLQNLKNMAQEYFSLYAVRDFITNVATATGEFEKQRVTLQAMIGEMEGLDVFAKIKDLSIQSPFQFKELASYAKQLASFSVPYEEIYDTTKRLADISAGVGVDMSRIILAYGQIKSAGVLKGTELRQLTEAGIPVLDRLAKKFEEIEGRSVKVGDVFGKISQKLVSFEMVDEIFKDLTSEGGQFFNMQEIQADTLAGKISNLKDAYDIMLNKIGESNEEYLKGGVEALYGLISNWETLGRVILSVGAAFTGLQAGKMLYWIQSQIKEVGKLIKKYRELKTEMAAIQAFGKMGGWSLVIAAVAGIGMAITQAYLSATKFNREMDKLIKTKYSEMYGEIDALDRLKAAIDNANKGSQERRDLIDEMNSRYSSYIGNMLKEEATADDVAAAHGRIADAIERRRKEEALLSAKQKVEEDYGSEITREVSRLEKRLREQGIDTRNTAYISKFVLDYIKNNPQVKSVMDVQKAITSANDYTQEQILGIWNAMVKGQVFNADSFSNLVDAINEYNSKLDEVKGKINAANEAGKFDSVEQADLVNQAERAYQQVLQFINKKENTPAAQVDEEKKKARLTYLKELVKIYGEATEKGKEYLAEIERINNSTTTWRDKIRQLAADKKIPNIFAPKEDESWHEYYERMNKEYKELVEQLENIGVDPQNMKPIIKARKEFLDLVAKTYKVQFDKKGANSAANALLKQQREEVDKLRNSYNNLFTLYKNFDKLSEGSGLGSLSVLEALKKHAGEENYEALKKVITGGGDIEKWFEDQFSQIAKDAIQKGGDTGKAFADSMSRALQNYKVKEDIDIFKIANDIEKELRRWGLEDFTLEGKGVTLDVYKIFREQIEANNRAAEKALKINELVTKARKGDEASIALLKEKYGENWLQEAIRRANELKDLEIANNQKIAEDKIAEMGKAYAKEAIGKEFSADFFSNLGEKSLTQLKETSAQLQSLMNTPSFMMDETFLDVFAAEQELLDKFIKQWQEYITLLKSDVDIEHFNKVKQAVVKSGKAVSGIIDSLKQFTDTDSGWANLLDGLGLAVGTATDIAGAFEMTTEKNKEGEVISKKLSFNWGSIASAAGALVSNIISSIVASREYSRQMEIAEEKFATSVAQSRRELEISGEKFETIFGENIIAALEADSNAISDLVRDMRRASAEISKSKITTQKGFLGIGKQTITLKDLAPQLFNADGSVNGEYLDEFLDAYGDKLDDSQKALLETLKTNYEQYKDAMEDINSYLSDIFSDTASSIADRMMEAFVQTGNAATELGDLVNGIAKSMAKDLIQSLLIDQYLGPAIDRVKSLYNPSNVAYEEDAVVRTQKAILAVQDAMQAAQAAVPEVNRILEAIQNMGIDLSGDTEKATDVLSGLTEQQQNLLMGYINGIRADVSYNKGLLSNIVTSVGTINNNIATAIIVWKQIEANTHRSADGVDRIIGFFESVMGPYDGGGGQAFQVNIA